MKEKWGWYNVHEGTVQDQVFNTAEGAIAEMQQRLGDKKYCTLEKIEQTGFCLALVEVKVIPLMIMRSEKGERK